MLPIKVAYITVTDPNDKHAWSGTNHYIWKNLKPHFKEIDLLGPDEPKLITFFCKVLHGFSLLVGKRFDYRHSTIYSKACGKLFEKKIQNKNYDLIISPGGVAYLAYLNTNIPKIVIVDRTIEGAINYHPLLKNLWKFSEKQSINTDKLAMKGCALNIYSSTWAANIAIEKYSIEKRKVLVIPFGANLDSIPEKFERTLAPNVCNLLFIGTNWHNKGGPIALECLEYLSEKGIKAHLTICGCNPEEMINSDKVTLYPFLNKNDPKDFKTLSELYKNSTFFILPTRLEAYGIVFCEAAAYSLPSIGTNTGGVSSAIAEGESGFLMPHEAKGKDYAEKIISVISDNEKYLSLCKTSRVVFENKFNWPSWAEKFESEIKKILS